METKMIKAPSSSDMFRALAFFRIGIGSFALLQMSFFLPVLADFMGPEGWIQWELTQAMNPLWKIHLADLCDWFHVDDQAKMAVLYVFVGIYLLSALGLTLGRFTRCSALMLIFLHSVLLKMITPFIYGADIGLHIALFYLVFFPSNHCYALDKPQCGRTLFPSVDPKFALRVLQIHLCLLYYSAGSEKWMQVDWWNGNAIFYALTNPDFSWTDFTWMANFRALPVVLGVFTILLESLYTIAMWIPYVRVFFLVGICFMHLGIMLFLQLYLFGWIMIVLSFSAWGIYAWNDVKEWSAHKKKRYVLLEESAIVLRSVS